MASSIEKKHDDEDIAVMTSGAAVA